MAIETIIFNCQSITHMFSSGADRKEFELRPPTIKGALRFWWRAMNGHLSLDELKKQEAMIFGSPNEKMGGRSKIIVRCKQEKFKTFVTEMLPHKRNMMKREGMKDNFEVTLSLIDTVELSNEKTFGIEQLKALFELTCILGGFGKRIRRGMGSSKILNYSQNGVINQYEKDITLSHVHSLLSKISPYFIIQSSSINYNHSGRMLKYGWIKSIEINDVSAPDIPLKISNTTNQYHKKEAGKSYESSLGHASRGRFASPVFVSLVDEKRVVITTLNTVPDKDQYKINLSLQENFKSTIFK